MHAMPYASSIRSPYTIHSQLNALQPPYHLFGDAALQLPSYFCNGKQVALLLQLVFIDASPSCRTG